MDVSSLQSLYLACERDRDNAVRELDDALAIIAARDEQVKALRRENDLLRLRVDDLLSRHVEAYDNL